MTRFQAESPWYDDLSDEEFLTPDPIRADVKRAAEALKREGAVPAKVRGWHYGALSLLARHLSFEPPGLEVLERRVEAFAERPTPFLPYTCGEIYIGGVMIVPPPWRRELMWIDPQRVLLSTPGVEVFFHDVSDKPMSGVPLVRGVAQFARRIAREKGRWSGLRNLFGGADREEGVAYIDVAGWETPLGPVFRINVNGNHRTAAFAALDAPAVLADVHWVHGPFTVSSGFEPDALRSYRRALTAHEICSSTDSMLGVHFSEWPMLLESPESAVASLAALETITGRTCPTQIGRLSSDIFRDVDKLARLGAVTEQALSAASAQASASDLTRRRPRWRWQRGL